MEKEIPGVKYGTDIEHIHRMRVASRRLRAILPLFRKCFNQKDYKRWVRSIKTVARALGTARDTDVQIAFLEDFIHSHDLGTGNLAIIDQILIPMGERRKKEQEAVLAALKTLEKERILDELRAALRRKGKGSADSRSTEQGRRLYTVARERISLLLDDLLAYESNLLDPADITGHHAMRIAAKNLRYTLEIYRRLYKNRLRQFIKNLKVIQEILGEIHDCDVWIGMLSGDLDIPGSELATSSRLSIATLLQDRKECREDLYRKMVTQWLDLRDKGFWDNLRKTVNLTR